MRKNANKERNSFIKSKNTPNKYFKQTIFGTAIFLFIVLMIAFQLGIRLYAKSVNESIVERRKEYLHDIVENMISEVDIQRSQLKSKNPLYTEEEIKAEIQSYLFQRIHNASYSNEAYIWVEEVKNYNGGDKFAIRLIHPNLVDTEGTYISTNTCDEKGNYLYRTQLDIVNESGAGYQYYYFKKLESNDVSLKIAYSKLYRDYDWIIAMGVNIDEFDIYVEEAKSYILPLVIVSFIFLGTLIFVYFIIMNKYLQKRDLSFYKRKQEKLKEKINWDQMTTANTRTFGEETLIEEIKLVNQGVRNTTVMILDVDNFKRFNDTYGHELGDKVLREVVLAVRRITRSSDHIIRWGGDEFVGIFRGLRKKNIELILNQIMKAIHEIDIVYNDEHVSVTVSIGFTEIKRSDSDIQEVVRRADQALYQSKENGRNRGTVI